MRRSNLRIVSSAAEPPPFEMQAGEFLTATQVAEILGCQRSKAYDDIKSGEIPSFRFKGAVRVSRSALRDYIAKCGVKGNSVA